MRGFPPEFSLELVISLVICLCVVLIFTAVIVDFALFSRRERVRREKRSLVDTATMTLFFLFFYAILQSGKGYLPTAPGWGKMAFMIIGTLLVVVGCLVNLAGRRNLGGNWANHIKIYEDHCLVTSGMYKLVRHPLYASIIMMFYGASVAYVNVLALAAVTLIFVPFMIYRARQEEALLREQFPDYRQYQLRTGMFFPKFGKRRINHERIPPG